MPVISQPSTGCSGLTSNGQSRACCLRWDSLRNAAWAIEFLPVDRYFGKPYRLDAANESHEAELSRMAELSSRPLPRSFKVRKSFGVRRRGPNEAFRARCVYARIRGRVRPRRMGPALAARRGARAAARRVRDRLSNLLSPAPG